MILVDTSVVIDYVRLNDVRLLALFQLHDAAICGIVRAEFLTGQKTASHRLDLIDALDCFKQLPVPDPLWDTIGDNLAELRRSGITVPLADAAIATIAIANNIELWTHDNHFQLMQKFLPALRLFQEPP